MVKSGVTGARFGQWFWITITAPGEDVLPWDAGACRHAPEGPCAGKLGCRVDGFDAAVWNGLAPRRWSWFMTYVRRLVGENAQYCGVWEYQERGVLHRHFLLRVENPIAEKRVKLVVRSSARRWGFGSQYDVQSITGDAAREVWYVAKYAAKTGDSISGRTVLDIRTGELKASRGFRPWSASREWGDSMKCIRQRQAAWACAGGAGAAQPLGAPGGEAALDTKSDISTVDSLEALLLPRFSAPSVPL